MSVNPSSFDNPVADSLKKSEFDEVNLATPTVYTSTSSPMAQAASNSTQPSPPRDDASTQSKQPSTVDPNILQQQAYPAQQQLAPQAGQPPVYTAVYAPGSGPFQPFGTHPEKAAYIIEADACAGGTYYVQGNATAPPPVIIVTPYSRIRLLNWAIFSVLLIFLPILIFWLIILSFD